MKLSEMIPRRIPQEVSGGINRAIPDRVPRGISKETVVGIPEGNVPGNPNHTVDATWSVIELVQTLLAPR